MKHYYSVINYYKRNDDKLKKLQLLVRLKLRYKEDMELIFTALAMIMKKLKIWAIELS